MAKRKIVINNKELTPTVLAIKQDKKKSSILGFLWIILIFAALIGCVYYMPEISSYVKQYIYPESKVTYNGTTKSNEKEQVNEEKEVKAYDFNNSLIIKIDNFSFSNFEVNKMALSFDINVTEGISTNLDNHNYFITIYSSSNQVLQRIKVSDGLVKPNETLHKVYSLNNSDVSKISLVELQESEYPSYTVPSDNNKNGVLTCRGTMETFKYYFKNNKLYAIDALEEVSKDDIEYTTIVNNYNNMFASYSNITGVSTEVLQGDASTTFKTSVDLSNYNGNSVYNIIYYGNGTDAKIVYFELNASGYTCS